MEKGEGVNLTFWGFLKKGVNLFFLTLFFAGKSVISKKAYFWKKAKGLTLRFPEESVISKTYFWKKTKGLTLLFAEKSVISKKAYFWNKAKGLTLFFAYFWKRGRSISKKAYFWKKAQGVNFKEKAVFEKGLLEKDQGVNLNFCRKIGNFAYF